jgi:hypothetical protein
MNWEVGTTHMLKYMFAAPKAAMNASPNPHRKTPSQRQYRQMSSYRPVTTSHATCATASGAAICFDHTAAAVRAAARARRPCPGPPLLSTMQATTPNPTAVASAVRTAAIYQVG